MEQRPRLLIGSPIRQKPSILTVFLDSLAGLELDDFDVACYFVDDNTDPESSRLLQEFGTATNSMVLPGEATNLPYETDEYTHNWKDASIWKVARYKDDMIRYARENDFDCLFLVDSDLVLHPLTIKQLRKADKEIISEIFWTKWKPEEPAMPQVWLNDHYLMHQYRRGEDLSPEEVLQRTLAFFKQLAKPGVYQVGGLGACTLISRRALEAGVSFAEIYNLTFWGEDRHFCIRAVALGLKLYVDTHLPAYHIYRESDLNGVAAFMASFPRKTTELLVVTAVREGLETWGSSDYRTITGLEGAEYLAPGLRAQQEEEREQTVQRATASQAVTRTSVLGLELAELDVRQGCALVIAGIANEGTEGDVPFRDAFVARVKVQQVNGQWLMADVQFNPVDIVSQAPAPTKAVPAVVRKTRNNKLTLSMVVRNEADRYLPAMLRHAAAYVDEFVIIDDASDDNTVEVCRQVLRDKTLTLVQNSRPKFGNEIELRRQQWELTLGTSPDWMLFLDADEIFEDRMRTAMPGLINQDQFDVVYFRLYDFWDSDHYREDKYWQAHNFYRPFLLRYRPDFQYVWRETAQHCGRMPANVTDLPGAKSDLRLKHLGWAAPADRAAKYERYMRLDPEGRHGILEQYRSILDPNPRLVRWEE